MLKAERLQAIVDITNKEKIVTSEELMRQLIYPRQPPEGILKSCPVRD